MPANTIEQEFPNIKGNYTITSPETDDYNCFAWALGIDDEWYAPAPFYGYTWPHNLPKNTDPQTMEALYRTKAGYEVCADGKLEAGFEKIALYWNNKIVTHAARQLPNGAWTSKLGGMEDVEHKTLIALNGSGPDDYGEAVQFLKRRSPKTR